MCVAAAKLLDIDPDRVKANGSGWRSRAPTCERRVAGGPASGEQGVGGSAFQVRHDLVGE
jgi:hypothetical protein